MGGCGASVGEAQAPLVAGIVGDVYVLHAGVVSGVTSRPPMQAGIDAGGITLEVGSFPLPVIGCHAAATSGGDNLASTSGDYLSNLLSKWRDERLDGDGAAASQTVDAVAVGVSGLGWEAG